MRPAPRPAPRVVPVKASAPRPCTLSPSAEMAMKYLVGPVPTTIRIDADGKQESRFSGTMDAETLCRYQAGKWKPPPKLDGKNIVSQFK